MPDVTDVQYDQMSPAAQAAVRSWKPLDASGAVGDNSQRTWSMLHSLVKSVRESSTLATPQLTTKLDVSTSPNPNYYQVGRPLVPKVL